MSDTFSRLPSQHGYPVLHQYCCWSSWTTRRVDGTFYISRIILFFILLWLIWILLNNGRTSFGCIPAVENILLINMQSAQLFSVCFWVWEKFSQFFYGATGVHLCFITEEIEEHCPIVVPVLMKFVKHFIFINVIGRLFPAFELQLYCNFSLTNPRTVIFRLEYHHIIVDLVFI